MVEEANRRKDQTPAPLADVVTTHDIMCEMLLAQMDEVFSLLEPVHMLPEGQVTEEFQVIHSPGGNREGYNTERVYLEDMIRTLPKPREEYLGGMVYVWDDTSHPFIGGTYSYTCGCAYMCV